MPPKVPAPPIEAAGSPEAVYLVEIGKIGADQRAKAASDIGERCRVLARELGWVLRSHSLSGLALLAGANFEPLWVRFTDIMYIL